MPDINHLERKVSELEVDISAYSEALVDGIEQRDSFVLGAVWGLIPGVSHLVSALWLGFGALCLTDWDRSYIFGGTVFCASVFWWISIFKKEKLERQDAKKLRPLPSWKALNR